MSEAPRGPGARVMTPVEIAAKAAAGRRAAATWRRTSVGQRIDVLRAVWKAVARRRPEIRAVVHEETGKPLVEVDLLELAPAALLVDWACGAARRLLEDRAAEKPWFLLNKRAYERRV